MTLLALFVIATLAFLAGFLCCAILTLAKVADAEFDPEGEERRERIAMLRASNNQEERPCAAHTTSAESAYPTAGTWIVAKAFPAR